MEGTGSAARSMCMFLGFIEKDNEENLCVKRVRRSWIIETAGELVETVLAL